MDRGRRLKALEYDASEILESYATGVPEEPEALGPEERHHVYNLLELRAVTQQDGSIKTEKQSRADDAAGRSNTLSGCKMQAER